MGGGGKTTTTTTVTQTEEEKEFTRQQIELAKQQLALTQQQAGWNSQIFELTKPLLEKYGLMVDQQFAEYNAPEAVAMRAKQQQLEGALYDSQLRQLPIQEELLQRQLDEIRRGGRATDEQKALIADIANRAIESGDIDISRFLDKGFHQIREELAPASGLRPTDSPVIDAGNRVLEEALRQKGALTSQVRGAQANAELNFPLNASQVTSAQGQFQQNFNANMNQFLAGLSQNAVQNRAQLMGQLFTAPMSAGEQGISLINASRPTPVSFPRNTTETTKTSGGSIFGSIGGILSGIGSVASAFSSKYYKENIKPITAPPGHVLSPGALKENIRGLGFAQSGDFGDFRTPSSGVRMPGDETGVQAPTSPAVPRIPFAGGPPRTDEEALDRIAALPVASWQYKPETGLERDTHIGPMAEDFNTQVMGKAPQPTINIVDSLGALTSAVKALDRRTRPGARPGPGVGRGGPSLTRQQVQYLMTRRA